MDTKHYISLNMYVAVKSSLDVDLFDTESLRQKLIKASRDWVDEQVEDINIDDILTIFIVKGELK